MRSSLKGATKVEELYLEAKENALIVQHNLPGVVRTRGGDRTDFLQRMSTNDLTSLQPGRWETTVFTNALARIVDHVTVLPWEEEIFLITSPARGQAMMDWLQGFIFFQDDIHMENQTREWSLWSVIGPRHQAAISRFMGELPDLSEGESSHINGAFLWCSMHPLPGMQLLLPAGLQDRLKKKAETEKSQLLKMQAYEILRVEAGIPLYGHEFSEESNPLEVGLQVAISYQKGCYIGQEIIARMHSRDRIPRRLAGLALDSEAAPDSPVYVEEKVVGRLTSVANSPRDGWIALAVLKSSALDQNAVFFVGEQRVAARERSLPFLKERG
jgi:folate-binding protein YgfZ